MLSDVHRQVDSSAGSKGLLEGAKAAVGLDQTDVETYEPGLPVVAFRFSDKVRSPPDSQRFPWLIARGGCDQFKEAHPDVQQKWMQTLLRSKGWYVARSDVCFHVIRADARAAGSCQTMSSRRTSIPSTSSESSCARA